MSNRTKKIILGIVVVLLAVAGAFAYWWFFMRSSPDIGGTDTGTSFPTSEETGGFGKLEGGGESSGNIGTGEQTPRLRQLTEGPVAGAVIFSRDGKILVRYAERGTGHLFEIGADEAAARRISNQTIPEIGEVLWKPDGSGVLVRYAKKAAGSEYIESFFAAVRADAQEGEPLRASFLPRNIRAVAFSPTGNTIFYLSENANGASGVLAASDGTKKSTLFDLPIKDLNTNWSVNDSVFLTTRAAAGIAGHIFSVGTQSGIFEAVTSDVGLTALPNRNGTLVLTGTSGEGTASLSVFNRSKSETTPLGIATIADKCVWSKRVRTVAYCAVPDAIIGNFPDSWYQGTLQTKDSVWTIDAEDGRADLSADLRTEARTDIDAFNFDISPDDQYLLFQNKNDLSLWLLKL